MLLKYLYVAASCATLVNAHGFLWAIDGSQPNVRGLSKLNTRVDDLRNPMNRYCRGEPVSSTRTRVTLRDSMTLSLAISVGANHVGYCYVEINGVRISPQVDCASRYTGCPGVPGNNAGDMCMQYWTFTVQNRNLVTCTDCTLRWVWIATHISPSEHFESCFDITISGNTAPSSVNPPPAVNPPPTANPPPSANPPRTADPLPTANPPPTANPLPTNPPPTTNPPPITNPPPTTNPPTTYSPATVPPVVNSPPTSNAPSTANPPATSASTNTRARTVPVNEAVPITTIPATGRFFRLTNDPNIIPGSEVYTA